MDLNKKEMEACKGFSQTPDSNSIDSKMAWWHIDKKMIRFKLHFFLYIGGKLLLLTFDCNFSKFKKLKQFYFFY